MIRPAPLDPATQLRWTRFVGNADIEPRDMPPRALLFVRRLPDPLPRRAQARPDAQSPAPEWEASVRAALSDCYHRSLQTGYAAATAAPASAVAFSDPAEMLAALAVDLCAGQAHRRWWWRTSLRDLPSDPAEALCACWIAQPVLVPAVIEKLLAQGAANSVLALLSTRQVWLVLSAVTRAFELTPLLTALNGAPTATPASGAQTASSSESAATATPPWRLSLPSSLSPAHQLLAGLAMSLRRVPQVVSAPEFTQQTVGWFHSALAVESGVTAPMPVAAAGDAIEVSLAHAVTQTTIETQLAGLLFLINLARSLDLFRRFDLSGWTLVELIARCLLTARDRKLLNDPIWQVLADLDGRLQGEPIATHFAGNAEYTLPSAWTEFMEPQSHHQVRFRSHRVQLWHPLGFMLSDTPACAIVDTAPLRRRIGRTPRVHAAGRTLTPPLRRFLAFLMPYLRYRLTSWLGDDLVRGLLVRRARIHFTATHIDVMLPIDAATVPVRAAGLDANPGWSPQLGRIVTFHYS